MMPITSMRLSRTLGARKKGGDDVVRLEKGTQGRQYHHAVRRGRDSLPADSPRGGGAAGTPSRAPSRSRGVVRDWKFLRPPRREIGAHERDGRRSRRGQRRGAASVAAGAQAADAGVVTVEVGYSRVDGTTGAGEKPEAR